MIWRIGKILNEGRWSEIDIVRFPLMVFRVVVVRENVINCSISFSADFCWQMYGW